MPRRRHNPERDVAGTAPYVKVIDPHTGVAGFLRLEPAIVPTSQSRFAKGRPLPVSTTPVPLFAAKKEN